MVGTVGEEVQVRRGDFFKFFIVILDDHMRPEEFGYSRIGSILRQIREIEVGAREKRGRTSVTEDNDRGPAALLRGYPRVAERSR